MSRRVACVLLSVVSLGFVAGMAPQTSRPAAPSGAPVNPATPPREASPPATQQAPSPVAVFKPEVADFGDMLVGETKTMTLKICNVSKKPITVTEAIPTCGCTVVLPPDGPIAPGACADITVTLKVGNGAHALDKKVHYMIQGHGPATLPVRGVIVASVTPFPMVVQEPRYEEGGGYANAAPTKIVFKSTTGQPFRIMSVSSPVFDGIDLKGEAKLEHVATINWAAWHQHGRQLLLKVTTDQAKGNVAAVTVRLAPKEPAGKPKTPAPTTAPATKPAAK